MKFRQRNLKIFHQCLLIQRVLLALVILKRLNELFSKKEQENKLVPERFYQGAEIFTYDVVGNRLTGPKEKLNYTYNQDNQLAEITQTSQDVTLNSFQGLKEMLSQEMPKQVRHDKMKGSDQKKTDYTYDKNGNLTKKIEYDDDGNIKTITLYTYDYENRLIRVEIQKDGREKIIEFTYDPFGRRLSKSVSHLSLRGEAEAISEEDDDNDDKDDEDKEFPRATYYVYDNEDIIMEYNHKGKVTARYVHGSGIDEPLAIERLAPERLNQGKGKVYYYHFDGLGSVTALTDAKGKVVQRYEYDSFGNLKHHGHKVKQPYTYTAREWDKETKLYYYRARYYDAKVGRFISVDSIVRGINHTEGVSCSQSISRFPLDKPKKLHPFVYTENNAINLVDPLGLGACGPGQGWGERLVPDNWLGLYDFSFFSPCDWHDKCYATCGEPKYKCDQGFLERLKRECSTSLYYADCMAIAHIYYGAVVLVGGDYYDNAQREACRCKQ